jgi:hypothetical protein
MWSVEVGEVGVEQFRMSLGDSSIESNTSLRKFIVFGCAAKGNKTTIEKCDVNEQKDKVKLKAKRKKRTLGKKATIDYIELSIAVLMKKMAQTTTNNSSGDALHRRSTELINVTETQQIRSEGQSRTDEKATERRPRRLRYTCLLS